MGNGAPRRPATQDQARWHADFICSVRMRMPWKIEIRVSQLQMPSKNGNARGDYDWPMTIFNQLNKYVYRTTSVSAHAYY